MGLDYTRGDANGSHAGAGMMEGAARGSGYFVGPASEGTRVSPSKLARRATELRRPREVVEAHPGKQFHHRASAPLGAAAVTRATINGACHTRPMDATLVMGQQGRLVIPVAVRDALGLSAGDELHLRLQGSRLVLERPQDAVAELRALGSRLPRSRSLVEELLAERRAAAGTE